MDVKKLKIHVVTWNVGNAQPAEDEIPFLFQGSSDITENDMIVVGVQASRWLSFFRLKR